MPDLDLIKQGEQEMREPAGRFAGGTIRSSLHMARGTICPRNL